MPIETLAREEHTEIGKLSRQVRRNIERKAKKAHPIRCARCPRFVVDPETAVFDNGRVSHAECAERINEMVDELNDRAVKERLAASGFEIPDYGLARV